MPGQSDGTSHELSRNAQRGKGMQTTVDSKATSDPYYNSSSSAANVQGNTSNNSSSGNSGRVGSNSAYAPTMASRKSMWTAAAGASGFGASYMLLRNMSAGPRLGAAAATGAALAYLASSRH